MRLLSILAIFAFTGLANAGEKVSFTKEIKPIFSKNCVSCHNSNNELPLVYRYAVAYELRNEIKLRVSDEKSMPKYTNYITESERDLIRQWVLDGGEE